MTEENIKKKEYLEQYRKAVRQMERSELRIHEIRMNKMHPSLVIDGLPHGSAQSDMSSYAAKLEEETQKYLRDRYRRVKLCAEIMNRIEQMDDEDEKDILTYRYIKLMKWEGKNGICQKMGISERGAYRLHGQALLHFKI